MVGKIKAVDLFCGIGGTTQGLKKAGISVVGAIDSMKDAIQGYRMNHPEVFLLEKNIRDVTTESFLAELDMNKGELDLLIGCPPCQGFSRIRAKSLKEGSKDDRNDLIFEYLRFVEGMLPKNIMLENVPGIKNDKRFLSVEKKLKELGYSIDYKIMDAANCGVPQRRKRFLLIGSRIKNIKITDFKMKKRTVRDAIGNLKIAGNSGDWMHDLLVNYREDILKKIKMIRKDGGSLSDLSKKYQLPSRKNGKKFSDVYSRMRWDDVSPTITCGCTSASKGRFLHPSENRAITLREAAILQGFPKSYKFPKSSNRQILAILIGNAFPPSFTKLHVRNIFS